jgi:hypothetical protein
MIELNDGTIIDMVEVLRFMALKRISSIAISQQHTNIWDHTNNDSLDFMLRCFSENMDTAQATQGVVEQFITSGFFEPATVTSTVTGRPVKGLQLIA